MTGKASLGGFLLATLALAACSSNDLGTGMNTVEHVYTNSVKEAHDAALMVLINQGLEIETNRMDAFGASIVAKRGTTSDKVLVDVQGLENARTQVSVRVQPGDKVKASLLQDQIGQKLTPAAR
jgi:hypothetical protein